MPTYLDTSGLAARAGLSPSTIRAYWARRPHLLPAPDAMTSGTPGWLPATVDAWLAARPGPTGRPRKHVAS